MPPSDVFLPTHEKAEKKFVSLLPLVQVLRMYRQQKKIDVKDENFKKGGGGEQPYIIS